MKHCRTVSEGEGRLNLYRVKTVGTGEWARQFLHAKWTRGVEKSNVYRGI